jgi:hypothetical protein
MPADLSRLIASARPPIERQSLALCLWGGSTHISAVYVATPRVDGRPGYSLRRVQPEPTPAEVILDGIREVAGRLA